jgi:hypothetical protein
MELALSATEGELLLDLLREELGRLKGEIYRTETAEYKSALKAREGLLVDIIGRLESGAPAA